MPDPQISVVVGGSGAIGQVVCQNLIARGDMVFCLDRKTSTERPAHFVEVDVSDRASVDAAFGQVMRVGSGHIRSLIYCAGILEPRPFLDLTEGAFARHLDINLMGAFRVGQSVALRMRHSGGAMVFVTSIHGQIGVPGRCAYAASKGAVASMVRVMAAELSASGIRVNALAPGPVDGGLVGNPETRALWEASAPSNRVARLSEVAQAAAMLTSDQASFINGQVIPIDGGSSVTRMLRPTKTARTG